MSIFNCKRFQSVGKHNQHELKVNLLIAQNSEIDRYQLFEITILNLIIIPRN